MKRTELLLAILLPFAVALGTGPKVSAIDGYVCPPSPVPSACIAVSPTPVPTPPPACAGCGESMTPLPNPTPVPTATNQSVGPAVQPSPTATPTISTPAATATRTPTPGQQPSGATPTPAFRGPTAPVAKLQFGPYINPSGPLPQGGFESFVWAGEEPIRPHVIGSIMEARAVWILLKTFGGLQWYWHDCNGANCSSSGSGTIKFVQRGNFVVVVR